jgi:hypothetical protein
MKRITKYCRTLKQAEQYLNRLYSKYDHVRTVSSPLFSEAGNYIFEVEP